MSRLRIGTRGSPLALWQAHAVETTIRHTGGPPCEIVTIRTTGDRLTQVELSLVGGKTVFVKEIEEALLGETVDLAVHSAKDLPAELPRGLSIRAVLPREDPRDALTLPASSPIRARCPEDATTLVESLGSHPTIGTGSVRRVAQLRERFPYARFEQIRGNVATRLSKLDAGDYDLLVLAVAGLVRLGLQDRISARLSVNECVPSPGQGIVAIETRTKDENTNSVLAAINDASSMAALEAERALLRGLGGDCHVPIGGVAVPARDGFLLSAIVASVDGSRALRRSRHAPADQTAWLGRCVAEELIADGANEIISEHRS